MTASTADRIGLDIGGTAIKAARVAMDGRVVRTVTVAAGPTLARAALLELVRTTTAELSQGDPIARFGVAVGGLVRADGAMPADATNLPSLAGVPLPDLFQTCLGWPCSVVNDAQAAMHGEAWTGAARGISQALLMTFGTGIGAGLLIDGRVRVGAHGSAGELGAWPAGGPSSAATLEEIAAPARFERRLGRRLGASGFVRGVDAETDAAMDTIGRALAAAHLLLDLERIILGGGIAAVGEPFRAAVEAAFDRACPAGMRHGLAIVTSALGPYSGAIGAVAPSVPEPAI
jgi:glucokinase